MGFHPYKLVVFAHLLAALHVTVEIVIYVLVAVTGVESL
jgi:hypothetical protein